MIETLILMDLHRGGSSPLTRLPLSQLTDSEQTPSSVSVWTVRVGVPTQVARIHSIKNLEFGEPFAVSVLAGCWCLVLSHNWDFDDLANVLNLCASRHDVVHDLFDVLDLWERHGRLHC